MISLTFPNAGRIKPRVQGQPHVFLPVSPVSQATEQTG